MKRIIGILMILSVFMALFCYCVPAFGYLETIISFAIAFGVTIFLGIAVWLIVSGTKIDEE